MSYLAIARKWRPSKFEDLVGQGHVVQTLRNTIALGRVSHAYLFSGARGVGKTSVARIFAKALRCPNAKDAIPCDRCAECQAIADSRSVDVSEIDGASNNGVEAVRGIRENVAYSASSGSWKIYIIDEVHMLSLSAFNALLKTLEEPPKHVVFVFATTEVQKIPQTILSRCLRFEFRRLTQSQIVERLQTILTAEKVAIPEAGLRLIASHSDGALRDALSLLDQVLSYAGTAGITEKQVVEALGVSDTNAVTQLWSAVLSSDLPAILRVVGDTHLAGVDLKHFAERSLEELRLLYLVALSAESGGSVSADELDISAQHFAELGTLAKRTKLVELERMAQILSKAITQLGWSSLPRFVLEMAAVRMAKLDGLARIEMNLQGRLEGKSVEAPVVVPKTVAAKPVEKVIEQPPPPSEPPPQQSYAPPPPPAPEIANDSPQQLWRGFVDTVMKKKPLLGALLHHADFRMDKGEEGRIVTIAFAEDSFYDRQAKDPKNRRDIEEWVRSYFGPTTKLASSVSPENLKSIETSQQEETAALKKDALANPTVQKMKEMLGAEVVDVNVEL